MAPSRKNKMCVEKVSIHIRADTWPIEAWKRGSNTLNQVAGLMTVFVHKVQEAQLLGKNLLFSQGGGRKSMCKVSTLLQDLRDIFQTPAGVNVTGGGRAAVCDPPMKNSPAAAAPSCSRAVILPHRWAWGCIPQHTCGRRRPRHGDPNTSVSSRRRGADGFSSLRRLGCSSRSVDLL